MNLARIPFARLGELGVILLRVGDSLAHRHGARRRINGLSRTWKPVVDAFSFVTWGRVLRVIRGLSLHD